MFKNPLKSPNKLFNKNYFTKAEKYALISNIF